MKFLNFFKSLVLKQKESARLKTDENLEYGQEWTSKMNSPSMESIKIPNEIVSEEIIPNEIITDKNISEIIIDSVITTIEDNENK